MNIKRRKILESLGLASLLPLHILSKQQEDKPLLIAHDFAWAFTKLKEGYGIRRKGWNVYLYLLGDSIILWNYGGKINVPIMDTKDILAEDWETI